MNPPFTACKPYPLLPLDYTIKEERRKMAKAKKDKLSKKEKEAERYATQIWGMFIQTRKRNK